MYQQEPPFCIQVELTEGCNLRCSFCGLNGIRAKDNDYKFLTKEDAVIIVDKIVEAGWNPRIEFAMHGEPTINPETVSIVRYFRKQLPKANLMMTSNGGGLLATPARIDALLLYLNVLALDWYENVNIVPKLLKAYKGKHKPRYYPKDLTANPHQRRKPTQHDLVVVQDIAEASSGTHATLNNHSGCGAPKNSNGDGKRCAKPFRELSIRWDGSVAVCCNDWRGYYKVGNVLDTDLEDLWQSPALQAARRKLYHGQRDFGPCEGCDALSYRTGLLPDKKGKQSLPEPTQRDEQIIKKALAGVTFHLTSA